AIVRTLTHRDPAAARRWFARLDPGTTFSATQTRASLLVDLSQQDGARREWETARSRLAWDEHDELRAFDAWRRLPEGAEGEAPRFWVVARRFWRLPAAGYDTWGAELARHLAEEPYDALA